MTNCVTLLGVEGDEMVSVPGAGRTLTPASRAVIAERLNVGRGEAETGGRDLLGEYEGFCACSNAAEEIFEFYGNIDEVNFRWQTEWGGEAEVALGFFPRPTTRSLSLPRHRVVL